MFSILLVSNSINLEELHFSSSLLIQVLLSFKRMKFSKASGKIKFVDFPQHHRRRAAVAFDDATFFSPLCSSLLKR